MTYKEIMNEYGVSRKTLVTWLEPFKEELGKKRGRYLTVAQVTLIYEKLGEPPTWV